jgi:hypothetical protein
LKDKEFMFKLGYILLKRSYLMSFFQIIERLYFFHNILGDGYGFFGKSKSNKIMKTKTISIVIQIKALVSNIQCLFKVWHVRVKTK